MQRINIYDFSDYRSYLNSYVSTKRQSCSNWSFGVWTRQLGLSNTSVIVNILKGKRHPGPQVQKKISDFFKLTPKERVYFKSLIQLEKSSEKDPALFVELARKIEQIHPEKNFHRIDDKTFSTISNWYFYAIREMSKLSSFQNDPVWVAKKLAYKVTPNQAQQAINIMLEKGLLTSEDGKVRPTRDSIATTDGISSEALKQFHEQMLDHAKTSIRKYSVQDRHLSGRTINIDKKDIPEIQDFIQQFRNEFDRRFTKNHGTETYQLSTALFPLTKIEG